MLSVIVFALLCYQQLFISTCLIGVKCFPMLFFAYFFSEMGYNVNLRVVSSTKVVVICNIDKYMMMMMIVIRVHNVLD